MSVVDLFVLFCFILGAVSAGFVAFHPNILYAALSLIFSLLAVAGMYGALGADFLAGAQLIIYVGGILIVILFAIMMSENIYRTRFIDGAGRFALPFVTSGLMLAGLLKLIRATHWVRLDVPARVPTTDQMGLALTGPYALVFQYVAVVLLAGLIGAVVVARPHYKTDAELKKDKR